MATIVIPAYRRGNQSQRLWDDLRVCLWSVHAYASDMVDTLVVWDGPVEPTDMPKNKRIKLVKRPDGMSLGQAWNWGFDKCGDDELIMLPDDAVLTPDAIPFLFEDLKKIRQEQPQTKIGMLGCRSNYVAGPQNIRHSHGETGLSGIGWANESTVFPVEEVYPVMAWFSRVAWKEAGGFPEEIVWYGDRLFSYDLNERGYQHFMGRSYVHHIGMRGTVQHGETAAQHNQEGLDWIRKNRPDFFDHLLG